MTLAAGTRLGLYQLVAPVGAGWMEAYRAKRQWAVARAWLLLNLHQAQP